MLISGARHRGGNGAATSGNLDDAGATVTGQFAIRPGRGFLWL